MSGGRVEIGLGTGWYDAEHRAFGLDFPALGERMDALDDQLSILTGLWSTPPGQTFELGGATTSVQIDADSVRPLQQPHPPIVMGGQAKPRSALLAVAYADEYNAAFQSVENSKSAHDRIRQACERAGRDPASIVYSAAQVVCCGATDAEVARRATAIGREPDELRKHGLAGSPQEVIDKIAAFADGGVERFYLQVLDLTDLDHLRLIASAVQPHVPGR
jgi:alkanesulfonate monooxygenase SsuD/methylene tetrahydromethanopterin reductase-like flavin-dependent oxidoreductase (luciferase family)